MRPLIVSTGLLAFTLAATASATPHLLRSEVVTRPGVPASPPTRLVGAYTMKDALARLALVAQFEQDQQELGPCPDAADCNFGGIHEVESGPGHAIVESDNTQQAIWIWSYQHAQDATSSHPQQITNAFEFLSLYPGWTEWQDSGNGPDYYSIYNCGWGVRAVLQYEAATGDTSHHAYGVQCAQHIHDYGLIVAKIGDVMDDATAGWGAAGLWLWGKAVGDATLQQRASDIGAIVKTWLDKAPGNASMLAWAVTGGAAVDGVLGSYMQAHPDELEPWLAQVAPSLGGWIDESQPAVPNDWTDWRNANAAWNMLAQFDAATALSGADADMHRAIALDILDKLWMQDADGDGAIPGSQQRVNAGEDESWVTAYFTVFGLQKVEDGTVNPPDAGALDAGDEGGIPGDDAGAGTPPRTVTTTSGCSCDVTGREPTRWGFLVTAALGLLFWRRSARRAKAY